MAWVTQGPITDRTVEHLGRSDVGIAMLRKQFKQQLAAVAAGRDPIAVVRDPAANDRIDLPCEKNKFGAGADFALQWMNLGFTRYSPQLQDLLRLHTEAAEARAAKADA
jgi:5,5'-dehydrodivanillate O-demethylase